MVTSSSSYSDTSYNSTSFYWQPYQSSSYTDISYVQNFTEPVVIFKTFIDSLNVGEDFSRADPTWKRIITEDDV